MSIPRTQDILCVEGGARSGRTGYADAVLDWTVHSQGERHIDVLSAVREAGSYRCLNSVREIIAGGVTPEKTACIYRSQ